jgi:hypothetical protein
MMKKNAYILTFLLVFTIVSGFTLSAEAKEKDLTGTWHFNVPTAPYGYQEGDMVFTKEDKTLSGKLVSEDNYSMDMYDIEIKGKHLSCKVLVQGMEVTFTATFNKKEMEGTASYSEGTLKFTAEKKKKK